MTLPFWGTLLRLTAVGLLTALGVVLALILWIVLTEGAKGIELAAIYLSLIAGTVVLVAAAPACLLWFLIFMAAKATGRSLRAATLVASAGTAATVALTAGSWLARFASPDFDPGWFRLTLSIGVLAVALALPLTALIVSVPKDPLIP